MHETACSRTKTSARLLAEHKLAAGLQECLAQLVWLQVDVDTRVSNIKQKLGQIAAGKQPAPAQQAGSTQQHVPDAGVARDAGAASQPMPAVPAAQGEGEQGAELCTVQVSSSMVVEETFPTQDVVLKPVVLWLFEQAVPRAQYCFTAVPYPPWLKPPATQPPVHAVPLRCCCIYRQASWRWSCCCYIGRGPS